MRIVVHGQQAFGKAVLERLLDQQSQPRAFAVGLLEQLAFEDLLDEERLGQFRRLLASASEAAEKGIHRSQVDFDQARERRSAPLLVIRSEVVD